MTEQNKDATDCIDAVAVCRLRLDLLDDAYRRNIHTYDQYVRLRRAIIAETKQTWSISLAEWYSSDH